VVFVDGELEKLNDQLQRLPTEEHPDQVREYSKAELLEHPSLKLMHIHRGRGSFGIPAERSRR
jgi:hypothetical protein